jgi:hypothetical protein
MEIGLEVPFGELRTTSGRTGVSEGIWGPVTSEERVIESDG